MLFICVYNTLRSVLAKWSKLDHFYDLHVTCRCFSKGGFMTEHSNQSMVEKIKDAINYLEDRNKTIRDKMNMYEDAEKKTFSDAWLSNNWQINIDIEKLKRLLFDCQYNPHMVTEGRTQKLFGWLQDKYDIVMA